MFSRQLDQLATQRSEELRPRQRQATPAASRRRARNPIRNHTGWTLVAIGLKIAESGSR